MSEWICTADGQKLYLERPEEFNYTVPMIAKSLSQLNRYTGHTPWPYSVAQHSIHVAEFLLNTVGPHIAMQGLFHDMSEVVINDISSPVKAYIRKRTDALKELEDRIEAAMAASLGLQWPFDPAVKQADLRILLNEKNTFFSHVKGMWQIEERGLEPLPNTEILELERPADKFLWMYYRLKGIIE